MVRTKTIEEIKIDIRQANDFKELKKRLEELCDYLDVFDESRNIELLSERISNIETCLSKNDKKINIDDLRL